MINTTAMKPRRFLTDADILDIEERDRPSEKVQDEIMAKAVLKRQRKRNIRNRMDAVMGLAAAQWLLT